MKRDCENIPCELPDCDCGINWEGLDYVSEIYIPNASDLEGVRMLDLKGMTAKGDIESISSIAIPKDSFLERIFGDKDFQDTAVGRFLVNAITSKRTALIIDVLSAFNPIFSISARITKTVTNLIIKPKQYKNMAQLKEPFFQKVIRFLKQESTRKGIAFVAGIVGAWFSIDIQPELLINSTIGIASGLSLLYAAWKNIRDIFRDDDA